MNRLMISLLTSNSLQMIKYCFLLFGASIGFLSKAQETSETFLSTRIVNAHSNEMLAPRVWQYRIEHRFGDLFGVNGGAQTAFGFDNAADIRFAFEHGLSKNIMVGVARNKGVGGPYASALLEGFAKVRLLEQSPEKKMPISLAIAQEVFYTYMRPSSDPMSYLSFPKDIYRFSYGTQMVITRKFTDRLSLALLPTFTHRNYVDTWDVNQLFSFGAAINVKVTKSFGLMAEGFYAALDDDQKLPETNSLALGMEFNTNGHNFRISLTNARGFGTVQYLAQNNQRISKGQFRLGFSITRDFKIRRH